MKYKNYYNFELGNRDIYSHNDILGMTVQDLFDNELPLSYQYNTIGIPKDDELINSPNTMQYTNANGKRRWRSSSKTTEDLLEEERQRRAALEAQNQAAQSQLSSIQPQSAPIDNNVKKNIAPSPIDNQPLLNNNTIGAIGNFAGKMINKFKNRNNTNSVDGTALPIPTEQQNTTMDEIQTPNTLNENSMLLNNIQEEVEKESENLFDQQTQQDPLTIDPTFFPDFDRMSLEELEHIGSEINAQHNQAKRRAKRNRVTINPDTGAFEGEIRSYDFKYRLRDSLANFARNFNVKEKWNNFQQTGFNKEDDLNLKEEMKDHYDILINNKTDYSVPMTKKEKFTDAIVQDGFKYLFPSASDVYTDGMTNFSRARNNPNAKVLENMDTLDKSTKEALYSYGVKPNERGVYYDANSDIAKKFANSPEVKRFFEENEQAIKQGKKSKENFDFDIAMRDLIFNIDKTDRFGSLQHAKMIDAYYDENGKKHGKFIDNVDYAKRNVRHPLDFKNIINNHGYNMQEKGNFENYYIVMDILLDDTIDESKKKNLLQEILHK